MARVAADNQIETQINTFLSLVKNANKIQGVNISFTDDVDRQRDSLAFAVDEVYRQFKDSDWQLDLKGVVEKMERWSSMKDPKEATVEIVNFLGHLFESRLFAIKADPATGKELKAGIDGIHRLYIADMKTGLETTPPGKAVKFGGIPEEFLPPWYLHKSYLKA